MVPTTDKFVRVVSPQAIVDDGSWTAQEIDTLGWDFCRVVVQLGATDIAMSAMKLQECDTSGGSFVDIPGADFSTDSSLPSDTDDHHFFAWNVKCRGSRKRFLKPVLTGGNGSTGTYLSAFAVLSRGQEAPSSASDRGLTAELSV